MDAVGGWADNPVMAAEDVRAVFEADRQAALDIASQFVDDPEAVVDEAADLFESMIPEMGYVDDPGHVMAMPIFWSSARLALYRVLAERGVGVHEFGAAALTNFAAFMEKMPAPPEDLEYSPGLAASAEASQRDARPGQFVYETFPTDDVGGFGINILSCGICHNFAKHDAMELVPYMCATDDVQSDRFGQGLRRTGTIALGAHHCDFRYKPGGESLRVTDQYPQQIRIRTKQ